MTAIFAALALCAPCAIENVRVEVGDGTVIENTTVVVNDGRIQSLGDTAPSGATRIDGTGRTLTPGFIEAHSQLGLVEISGEPSMNDGALEGALVPGFLASWAYNHASARLAIEREEGVTSAVVAPRGGLLSGGAVWADLDGRPVLPDAPPVALVGTAGHAAAREVGGSRGGIWLALRQAFEDARHYAVNRSAFDRGQARPLSLTPLHLEALRPLVDGSVPLLLHVNREADILTALAFAELERIRLVISGGAEAWKVAPALARAKVPVLVRPSVQGPGSFDTLGGREDVATLLNAAGVPVVISTGPWSQTLRRLRQEAGIAVAYGLPHAEAIRAITQAPAQAFGRNDVGAVRPGMRANLVLWSGDPLELSSIAERVWVDGVEQSMDNRQRQLVERYR